MMILQQTFLTGDVRFHHWKLRFSQSRFHHIARVLHNTILNVFRSFMRSSHALVPFRFRVQVSEVAQKSCSSKLLLSVRGI